MALTRSKQATAYSLLQVHPAAPDELISAAYWRLIGRAQVSGGEKGASGAVVRQLNQAYKTLSDPKKRAAYDRSLKISPSGTVTGASVDNNLDAESGQVGTANGADGLDYYELLRVDPAAEAGVIEAAYEVMRSRYQTLIDSGEGAPGVLELLERAFQTTRNPEQRRIYNAERVSTAPPPSNEPPPAVRAKRVRAVTAKPARTTKANAQARVTSAPKPSSSGAVGLFTRKSNIDRDGALFTTSLILSGISALCLVTGMATSNLQLNDYGLAGSFPAAFYLGLVFYPLLQPVCGSRIGRWTGLSSPSFCCYWWPSGCHRTSSKKLLDSARRIRISAP